MPRGVETLHANAATVQGLFDWGKRLVDAAAVEPAPFNESADRRAAAQVELVETLLAALRETAGREPDRGELAKQEQSRIVKIAEDYALAHVGERLYVSDLCRVTAVSERALEYAFKQTLGLAPVAYLARLRLHRVRNALQTPDARHQDRLGRRPGLGVLALRRVLARLQGLLRRAAVGDAAPPSRVAARGSSAGPASGRAPGPRPGASERFRLQFLHGAARRRRCCRADPAPVSAGDRHRSARRRSCGA